MPNFRTITVGNSVANNGVPIQGFDGDGALSGPSAIVIFASNSTPLPANDPTITITLHPSGHLAVGTDGNGNISVTATLVNAGDDINFNIAGGGTYTKLAGLWQDQIRATLVQFMATPDVEFDLQYSGGAFVDFVPSPPPFPRPDHVQINSITPNSDLPTKNDIVVQLRNPDVVTYPNLHALITRSTDGNPAVMVGTTPVLASGDQTFTDVADMGHSYTYYVYLYDDTLSITETPATASTVITADPSGLYVITAGKTNDTLYDNHTGPTTQDFAIPQPFIKTGFIDG
jgi:hypothetical protein